MKIFSVGVIGAGTIVRNIHLPVLKSMPNARVAWIADASAQKAEALAHAYGLKPIAAASPDTMPDCDVVLLAIPVGVRAAYYEAFAARKIAVFAEKPFAVTAQDHRRFADLFAPGRIACGYMRRFYGSSVILDSALREGHFGPLQKISVSEGGRTMRSGSDRYAYDDVKLSGGGALMTLGCHSLDLVLTITAATGFEVLSSCLAIDGKIDRKVEAVIRLTGGERLAREGCELHFCLSWLDYQKGSLELEFPRARLITSTSPGQRVHLFNSSGDTALPLLLDPGHALASTFNQAFYLEWQEFFAGLAAGGESRISARSAQIAADLIDAIYDKGGYLRD